MTRPAWELTDEDWTALLDKCDRESLSYVDEGAAAQARKIGEHLETVIANAPRGRRLIAVERVIEELKGEVKE